MSTKSRKRKQLNRKFLSYFDFKDKPKGLVHSIRLNGHNMTLDQSVNFLEPITLTRKSIIGVTVTNRKADDIDMY